MTGAYVFVVGSCFYGVSADVCIRLSAVIAIRHLPKAMGQEVDDGPEEEWGLDDVAWPMGFERRSG